MSDVAGSFFTNHTGSNGVGGVTFLAEEFAVFRTGHSPEYGSADTTRNYFRDAAHFDVEFLPGIHVTEFIFDLHN